MKNRISRLVVLSMFLFVALLGIGACSKDKTTTPSAPSGFVTGIVYSQGRAVLAGVSVKVGTISTETDIHGMYMLSGVPVGDRIKVDFEKAGFIFLQKTINVENGKTSSLSCTLFEPVTDTFVATAAKTLNDGSAQIDIPADAFVDAQGTPYSGSVLAEIKYFDPFLPECMESFPGSFSGLREDGTTTDFESYGFLSAQFFKSTAPTQELNLASGKKATLTAAIPWSLQANAPATMPLWYYDDAAGIWKEQGFATKVGNNYVGNVSHFTYWNFDQPITISDQATITGKVVWNNANNTPIANAQVVATGVDYAGYTKVYSAADGSFSISVKANSHVIIRAYVGQNSSPNTATINTPAGEGTLAISDIVITDESYILTGRLLDANNQPLANEWGNINVASSGEGIGSFSTDAEGYFSTQVYPPNSKASLTVYFSTGYNRNGLYSSNITFPVPQIGQIYNFPNPIVMGEGGKITGLVKDNNGNLIINTSIMFMQTSGTQQGEMFSMVDENGRFEISRASNSVVTGVRAYTYSATVSYITANTFSLNFPGAGQTNDIGTLNFIVAPGVK
ncbi:hypothetical protein MASR2M64_08550 [Candidatus Cloacimonadota bacterium]